jgi:acyl carrier protein
VSEAVAQAPPDGNDRVAAYVVLRGGRPIDPPALAAFLRALLPGYMVPGTFVVLPSLPRSPHGKIDRTALAAGTGAPAASARVPPRNDLERQLADLWAELLDRPDVGVADNFFELGGHSLLAMQLLSRVQAALGVEVSLRTLFETPTVAELAAAIAESGPVSAPAAISPDRGATSRDLLPLEVDRLSDTEVEALLAELLAEGDGR